MTRSTLKLISPENFDPQRSDSLPITKGSMAEFAKDPIGLMRVLHETHGDVAALQDESGRAHFIFSPEFNQQVLSDSTKFHSNFFAIRGSRKSAQRRLTLGLLSMNGTQHKTHRREVKGPFSRRSVSHYHDAIVANADELINDTLSAGTTIDLNEEMTHYMLRVVSELLFGIDVPELAYEIGEMVEDWVSLNHKLGPAVFASHPELMGDYENLLDLAERLELKMKELIRLRKASVGQGTDVLSLLIRASEASGMITEEQLIGHVTLMFAAAHLTTAHTMTWTTFLLSQHPEIMQSLYSELSSKLNGEAPTEEQFDQLPILERVLKESMRIMPASSYSQRINQEPIQLGRLPIRANSVIIFSQFMTHHRADLYEDPEAFNPDRWLNLKPSPYQYLPFGAGPRLCIGAPLAMNIMKISLPKILQRYRFTVAPETEVNANVISTMMMPLSPIMMELHEQDQKFSATPVTGSIHNFVNLPKVGEEARIARAA